MTKAEKFDAIKNVVEDWRDWNKQNPDMLSTPLSCLSNIVKFVDKQHEKKGE
ncbi:unnamed protein product [marine sediment metagenome]|uniref:Uncharacterized protein n=1 Tax=marine sediment metagenome TaxID=412755 RepID=X1BDR4_9ZZZZ